MLKLIVAFPCPFCNLVLDYIEHEEIKDIEIIDTKWDQNYHEKLKKSYGKTQVPLLLIDDKPLYESMAIIKYLEASKNELS
ncbi:MAG: glutathione S-transferase N-terminal domain-containing protein [Candidatus Margulisiibacteriota bacterium]